MCANHYTKESNVIAIIFEWTLVYASLVPVEFAEFNAFIDSAS